MDSRSVLEQVRSGKLSVAEAESYFNRKAYENLNYARLDTSREQRTGFAEVVYCSGKPDAYLADIFERLTGIEIDYYLMTTFTAFEDLVDALGGVTVDVPKTVKVPDPSTAENVTVTKGDNQTLDGSEALVFARARKEYVNDQDAVRQVNVRQLEQSIICNVLGMSSESEIDQALIDLRNNTTSNMDMGKLGYMAMDFAMHESDVVLYSCTGPYSGGVNDSGLWVVNADAEAWGQLMDVVSSGGDPSGIVAEPAMP